MLGAELDEPSVELIAATRKYAYAQACSVFALLEASASLAAARSDVANDHCPFWRVAPAPADAHLQIAAVYRCMALHLCYDLVGLCRQDSSHLIVDLFRNCPGELAVQARKPPINVVVDQGRPLRGHTAFAEELKEPATF